MLIKISVWVSPEISVELVFNLLLAYEAVDFLDALRVAPTFELLQLPHLPLLQASGLIRHLRGLRSPR